MEVPGSVEIIWTVVLVVAYLCVPVVLVLLTRIVHAARKIENYARDTKESAVKLTGHLEAVAGLAETEKLLGAAVEVCDDIGGGTETLAGVLAERGARS